MNIILLRIRLLRTLQLHLFLHFFLLLPDQIIYVVKDLVLLRHSLLLYLLKTWVILVFVRHDGVVVFIDRLG